MSRNGKIIIGLLSLVGVLLYNWTHTGGLLASYVKPEFVGYIAAAGIELAVVGLSLRIDEMRRAQADAKFHVATLAAVVIVSALANIAQGYLVKFGTELTSANIGRLDAVQVVVSLAATGLLSLVVFALAEVVGHDIGASGTQPTGEDCHCPICRDVIGLPVWLFEQHGDKYLAYCDKCQRAYTESEVAWLPSKSQVGASLPQPLAQGQQVAETDETYQRHIVTLEDTALESTQQAKTWGTQVFNAEPVESIVVDKEPLKSPVLSAVTFDGYTPTGNSRADVAALLVIAKNATNASMARKLGLSDERVRQLRASLAQEAQGVTK